MALDPMVGHSGDVWTLLLTRLPAVPPPRSCAHLSSPDLPLSPWRIRQGLSVLDFVPEPDARLGCGPGGPSLRDGQNLALCLRPFVVSGESGHRRRKLDREDTALVLGSKFYPTLLVSWGPPARIPFYS